MLNVREIIRLCPITPVPRMPPYVKGVINLRGTVIAVLDLRAKFQLTPKAYGERTCIIVVQVTAPSGGSTLMGDGRGRRRRGGTAGLRPISRPRRSSEGLRRPNTFWVWLRSRAASKSCSTSKKSFWSTGHFSLPSNSETETINPTRSSVNMNNWTISRRIIAGFITMLLITVALGLVRPLATDRPCTEHRGYCR